MGLFQSIFGKKKSAPSEKTAERKNIGNKSSGINLSQILTDEEMRLLITDLGLIENKVDPESRRIVSVATEIIQSNRSIAPQVLDLCIAAVQDAMNTFSAFGMVPGGTSALLEKLKAAKESAEDK